MKIKTWMMSPSSNQSHTWAVPELLQGCSPGSLPYECRPRQGCRARHAGWKRPKKT